MSFSDSSRRDERLAMATIAVLCTLAFLNCVPGMFLWDDQQFVVENLFLRSWRFLPDLITQNLVQGAGLTSNLYRPLQSLTHFVDWQIWGMNAAGHRLTNVILHTAGIVLFFRLLLKLLEPIAPTRKSIWISASVALLYGLHPLQCPQVAYISGRSDPLLLIFLCLSALCLRKRWPWSFVFMMLGIFSKENGMMIPVFLLGCDWYWSRRENRLLSWRRHLGLWSGAATYFIARLSVLNFQNTLNFYSTENILTEHPVFRIFTYFSTLPKGLLLWLWPIDLHHERSWSVYTELSQWPVAEGALLLLLGCALVVFFRKKLPLVSLGIAWFFLATFPTSNLVILINALFYDHWFLFPGVGLAIALAGTIHALRKPLWASAAATLGCVAVLPLTLQQNRIWLKPISLFEHVLRFEPKSTKIMNNLAMSLAIAGEEDRARELYLQAIATLDIYAQTHHNLALLYRHQGKDELAESEFKKAISMDPRIYQSYLGLGDLYFSRSRYDLAEQAYESAARIHPTAEAYQGLISCAKAVGNPEKAADFRDRAIRLGLI